MLFVPDPSIERVRPPQSTPRRWLRWAGLASVLLHAALLGAALWWMRQPRVVLHLASQPATVQLVMSPPGSDHNAAPSAPSAKQSGAKPGARPAKPTPPQTAPKHPETALKHNAPAVEQSHVARRTPEPTDAMPEQTAPPETAAAAQPAQHSFTLNLGAVESDTNALVTGNIVVPPSPDIKFYNRKPSYPDAAAMRGEQGTVVLLVHVQPDGLVSRVEVAKSSGYERLDNSAREAVQSWHFLPSVSNGQPIASVVPLRIVYALEF
jgi:periplasmic protein TonB